MLTGIIGAGPSGLSMAMFLDGPVEVLERGARPGGHAASYQADGFTFDYGPHIMFSRNKPVLDFMVQSLGDNVHRCRRNNKISYKGALVKFPFENDLAALPFEDRFECLRDFVINPYAARYPDPADLEQWLLAKFGRSLCDKYLIPYNEKVWNVPVAQLSMLWADRIPSPDPEDVIRSALGDETEGYLHQLYYHYPLRGGYQAICDAWAKRVEVDYGYDVQRLQRLERSRWRVTDGAAPRDYDRLISTMPVHALIDLIDVEVPVAVRDALGRLIVNPMIVISLGITGSDPDLYTAIYFPETDFLVNRVSYPATFSPHNAPPGAFSIQAEITCRDDAEVWTSWDDDRVADHVVGGLLERGLIAGRDSVCHTSITRSDRSYVVYDVGYEERAEVVREWFRSIGIELVGRFSFFEYINVDGAIERALEVAGRLNGAPVDVSAAKA